MVSLKTDFFLKKKRKSRKKIGLQKKKENPWNKGPSMKEIVLLKADPFQKTKKKREIWGVAFQKKEKP